MKSFKQFVNEEITLPNRKFVKIPTNMLGQNNDITKDIFDMIDKTYKNIGGYPDFKKSAELAGYSGNHYQVLKSLKEEVVDLAQNVLAREAPTAAFKIIEVLKSDRPIPQANYKLQAAQTILDRVGVSKTDRIDVNHNTGGGIFILPEKKAIDITEGDYEDISD